MLNTEVGTVLAVLRRSSDGGHYFAAEECYDTPISQSLKSLRALIFNPQQEWRNLDPSLYLLPFLDVIQNDEAPAAATGLALSSIFKILKLEIFDHKTPGVREAINSSVAAITSCRLEKTDPVSEDAVMMKILQVLTAIMAHPASIWLTDQAVCTVVNSCFQVVQQSASRGDLLQRSARFTMHELVHIVYSRLPEVEVTDWENSESDTEDSAMDDSGYGIRAAVDIFHFLCSLLNVVEVVESDGVTYQTADESIQLFALVLINSAIELSGDSIGMHPKLLRMIQDDLFHHLIHYGSCSRPLVLSMICSTVLNIYHFLRRSVRLQLEAFFSFVLFKVAGATNTLALQEVAVEGLINFCRQPTFVVEAYVNYDCDPTFRTVFEDTGKLLCRHAYPSGGALTSLQLQSFEGLSTIIHNIADNIDREGDNTPSGPHPVEIGEYRPFWEERVKEDEDLDTWIDFVRVRKAQKRKILIAGDHFSRDEKKGLEYLKHSGLVSNSSDPKAYAMFFRYTPKLDKTAIGDFLGDPEDFHLKVLKEFTDTFEFTGMVLDNALRTYLESFRLPGESQKIQRVLEAFAERFYEQQSSEIFYSKDAVFILNNRAINSGQDLPREYLSELFQSISANAILFDSAGTPQEMSPNQWIQLINRSKRMNPYIMCDFDRRLGRDLFASIAGPSVATLAAIFEQADEEEVLHECIEALFSIARICQYGLDDTLDELVCTFCKFTTLLNPYASAEETLYAFSNDMKPRMATLAVFTIANNFKNFIRGGWRTIVDCLLKLKKLKLLPQSVVEPEAKTRHERSASTSISASQDSKFGRKRHPCGVAGRFSQFLSMDNVEESLNMGVSEFENNLKIISQCRIGSIFNTSSSLPEDTVQNLGRSLIYSAAGKGQKFSTAIEEEETVGFCWDLIVAIASANINRLPTFWPYYHEYLLDVAQYPLFSPIQFAEKAIVSLMKICLKLLSSFQADKAPEELIFKSINLMWKIEKEILDTCSEFIVHSVTIIMNEYPANLQTVLGWKSVLHLLSITGRHPEMYDQKVEAVINLMSDGAHISRLNYPFCIETSFGFVALKNSPLEKNIKIMDLMTNTVTLLVNWFKSGYSDPGGPSSEENKALMSPNFTVSCFVKLGEAFRKTSLSRREEIRNHAVISLQKSFSLAEDLGFTPSNIVNCFKLVIFAMVDDLHEKMLEYSKRENAERETRGMEGTLKLSMEMLTGVYLQYLKLISESPDFRGFWMGVLRRMDTCMKADLGEYGESRLQDNIPELLKKMVSTMKEKEILVQKEDDDLWEMTYIQIQWIAPSLKEELFPDN
nr:ARF guanine-nucleotide exchange factor GNL2 [Ipomoea batatas]